jgi:hypothetical protein
MLIVFKIVLVAFAVFGQVKLFPEHQAAAASSLDSVDLSVEKPELVLAHRAMEAQGLCPSAEKAPEAKKAAPQDGAVAPATRVGLVGNCN